MKFYLYKGLKKPLVLFGLKDKYIYWAIGLFVVGFVLGGILSSFGLGFYGTLIGFVISGIGIWGAFKLQDTKGLYNKTKNDNELHIFPARMSITKFKRKKVNNEQGQK